MTLTLSRFQGSLAVLLCGLSFSFGPLTFRALREADEWQYLSHRSFSAALVSALIISMAGRNPVRAVVDAGIRQFLAGLVLGTMFTLFVVALSRVSAAFVLLMQTTSPFYAAFLARVFLREPISRDTVIAMVAAAIGVGVMVGGNLGTGDAIGIVLSVALAVALGSYSVLIRSTPTGDPGVPTLVAGTSAGVGAGLVALFSGAGVAVPGFDLAMAFLAGGVLIGLFVPVWNFAHRFVPTAEVNMLIITEVVMAPIWLWVFRDEEPTKGTLIGGAITLFAVCWLTLRAGKLDRHLSSHQGDQPRGLHAGAVPGFQRRRSVSPS